MKRALIAATLGLAVLGQLLPATAGPFVGLPALVEPIDAPVQTESYPFVEADGARGRMTWRTVDGTGNGAENYLAVTREGWIADLGGADLNVSKDEGQTWERVIADRPRMPVSDEGAVAAAPGGDIVGIFWNGLGTDQVTAVKYDAGSDTWSYSEVALHTPFYDRPWLAVIPGPYELAGQTAPYAVLLKGGWPSKDVYFVSLDGLNYVLPSNSFVDGTLNATRSHWLDLPAHPEADWVQPHTEGAFTPLNGLGALGSHMNPVGPSGDAIMAAPGLSWAGFSTPDGQLPPGRLLVDSEGTLHLIDLKTLGSEIVYRISRDGGRTWAQTSVSLPDDYVAKLRWDFKVNAALGATAVAVHAYSPSRDADQDLIFKFAFSEGTPSLERTYYLGGGGAKFDQGIGTNSLRFDFSNVGFLPDGRLVTSFADVEHPNPTLAIELEAIPEPTPSPSASSSASPSPTPSPSPSPIGCDEANGSSAPSGADDFFLHSETGVYNVDEARSSAWFDGTRPVGPQAAMGWDPSPLSVKVEGQWRGSMDFFGDVDASFDRFTLDVWQDDLQTDISQGYIAGNRFVSYHAVRLVAGEETIQLPCLEFPTPQELGVPHRVTHTFTTKIENDRLVPLDENISGPITVILDASHTGPVYYDSADYPSGFSLWGSGSSP